MMTPITVNYNKAKNFNTTHAQNANPYVGSRIFKNIEDAKTFAETVDVKSVIDYTGKNVTKMFVNN